MLQIFTEAKLTIRSLLPNLQDWKDSFGALWRGSIIGFFVGVLPGAGATIASFMAYAVEKKVSKHPELFGTGVIEGVAAPEGANNAAAGGALVPLLTLGIPGSGTTAVMLGALMIHGLRPGPMLFSSRPDFVWGADRQHVHRECDAHHPEHADDRPVGPAAEGSLQGADAADHHDLGGRRLRNGQ